MLESVIFFFFWKKGGKNHLIINTVSGRGENLLGVLGFLSGIADTEAWLPSAPGKGLSYEKVERQKKIVRCPDEFSLQIIQMHNCCWYICTKLSQKFPSCCAKADSQHVEAV